MAKYERAQASLPIEEIRRNNLRERLRLHGGSSKNFVMQLPFGAARLSQLIAPASKERFDEHLAATIERALRLAPGSMSRADGAVQADKRLDDRLSAEISSALLQAAVELGILPTVEVVQEVTSIVAENARKTGMVDPDLVISLTRTLLARETGKGKK